ncbi:MAG: hypothetical protein HKL90_15800 [Elusimicrobia bacterium]|nr:hypothetical protein [Elusimicrobiota bacterium]
MRRERGPAVCLLAASLSACATLSSKSVGSWGREYSGVRCVGTEDYWSALDDGLKATQLIYSGTDYLFSAAADTALLPFDLIVHGVKKLTGETKDRAPLCNDNSRPG